MFLHEKSIELTSTEFKLLITLIERRGRVQTRDDLLDTVWGYEYSGYGRTVDTHVRRLSQRPIPPSARSAARGSTGPGNARRGVAGIADG